MGPQCVNCPGKFCSIGVKNEAILPDYCPIKTSKDLIEKMAEKYFSEEIRDFYLASALNEKEAYDEDAARKRGKIVPVRPRIREIVEFAKKIGVEKIGVAFCSGLRDEAERVARIFERHGLKVYSVICCCGALDKTRLGVPPEYKIFDPEKFESACNPILQAALLNNAGTEINVIVGLCVGHDMLFTKYSKAYVTTLIVKDRFTGHNPVITLYSRYHKDLI